MIPPSGRLPGASMSFVSVRGSPWYNACKAGPQLWSAEIHLRSSPFATLTTPGRLRSLRSASSLSFLVTCRRQVIPSHSFAALTALIVRRENGNSALLYCTNGFADQPRLACTKCRATPKGVERAPGSGTLPPLFYAERYMKENCIFDKFYCSHSLILVVHPAYLTDSL